MRKGNFEHFIELSKNVHNGKYDYSVTKEPKSVKDEIEVLCPIHGVFTTTFDKHIHSKVGCPKCSSRYVDTDSLVESFKKANPNKNYSYEFVEYNGSKGKVKVFCHEKDDDGREHGIFEIRPNHLLNGHGCPKCSNRYLSTDDWIKMARNVHGDKYDYSKVEYKKNTEKVCIICPEHGEFWQVPYSHIAGCGCPKCNGGVSFNKDVFIDNARKIHGDKYDYSKFVYVNANTEGTIICPIHGEFSQTPYLHVNKKHGCPKCKSMENNTMLSMFIDDVMNISTGATVSGNRIKFKDKVVFLNLLNGDSKNILERQRSYKKRGMMVFDVFEDEYITRRKIVLSKIRHLFGLDENTVKISARKCDIKKIDKDKAEAFLENNHIQGFVASSLYYGCFYDKELVAVMAFKEEKPSMWNLTRYATKIGTNCRGCASKLFKSFVRENNPIEVKSFADKRWTADSKTNLYTKLGFEYVNSSNSRDYRYWKDGVTKERMHKFGFRKNTLHNRYGLPLTMTEKEMTEKLGYIRIWDCGLFKYVWKRKIEDRREKALNEKM